MVRLSWLAALCLGLFTNNFVHASDSPYQLNPALDATTIGVSALVWGVGGLAPGSFVAADGCVCRAASVNSFDRPVAGRWHAAPSIAGDLMVASLFALAPLLDMFDVLSADEPYTNFLIDLAIMAEVMLVNGALNQVVKFAVARPRPLLYGHALDHPRQSDPDSYMSFYSAHTSSAFALALTFAQTFAYRHPDSPYRFLVYGGALLAASAIGATRIASGKHFPSDVLVGAAAGTAIGLAIPWLHRKRANAQLSFAVTPESFGVSLTVHQL